jgi:general secretion pathway protein B
MSYILDALRKSEQQRQHAAAPTLLSARAMQEAPKPKDSVYRAGIAAALVCAGILIGWWRPWQAEPPPLSPQPLTPPLAAQPLAAAAEAPDALPASPGAGPEFDAAPPLPAPSPVQTQPAMLLQPGAQHAVVEPGSPPVTAASPAPARPENEVLTQGELPETVRQALPGITIAFHQYSNSPEERRVMINNIVLRQGEMIAPDLKLELITAEGVVLGFQGYRFKRGVR